MARILSKIFSDLSQRQAVDLLDEATDLLESHADLAGARELVGQADRLMDGILVWLRTAPSKEDVEALLEEARTVHRQATALVAAR